MPPARSSGAAVTCSAEVGAGAADGTARRPVRREMEDAYLRQRGRTSSGGWNGLVKALLGKPRKLSKRAATKGRVADYRHTICPPATDTISSRTCASAGSSPTWAARHRHRHRRPQSCHSRHRRHTPTPVHAPIRDDDLMIVDGYARRADRRSGSPGCSRGYRLRRGELELERSKLKRLRTARAATLDGVEISLQANIQAAPGRGCRT